MTALQKYNTETVVQWQMNPTDTPNVVKFQYLFWAFKPSIDGFTHCHPVICVDGTHINGKYKGKILVAMGIDADNSIFPLAFAIIDEETLTSWSWFLRNLSTHVVLGRQGICLISDRHSAIINVVDRLPEWRDPNAYHRFYLRHFQWNFHKKFKDILLKDLVWKVGIEHQIKKFNNYMDNIEQINSNARRWLDRVPSSQWSLVNDGGHH